MATGKYEIRVPKIAGEFANSSLYECLKDIVNKSSASLSLVEDDMASAGITIHNDLDGRSAKSCHPGTSIRISVTGITSDNATDAFAELLAMITAGGGGDGVGGKLYLHANYGGF